MNRPITLPLIAVVTGLLSLSSCTIKLGENAAILAPAQNPAPVPAQIAPPTAQAAAAPIAQLPEATPANQPAPATNNFNAEIFDPPSNCRSGPTSRSAVVKSLQRGDVLVDRNNFQLDASGASWFREMYLNCWLHESQIQFKGTSRSDSTLETVQTIAMTETVVPASSGYVAGTCKQLKAKGLGRFSPGDANYTSARDRDSDGIACE
jgi:Excalibur calcium-binding domain